MNINASFIERLRHAAEEHGAVYDLLAVISEGLIIDDLGNNEIIEDNENIQMLKSAQFAFEFAKLDRKED